MDSSDYNPRRIFEEAARRLAEVVPEEAVTHFINAQKEVVLGLTALVQRREPEPSPASRGRRRSAGTARGRRPRRVNVV